MKHGLSNHKLYRVLIDMKRRCYNKDRPEYIYYGARGIEVCQEWRKEDGIIEFYKWSLGNGYKEGLSIDRIDVNGNYEPSNCRWITVEIQNKNKRDRRIITINNINKSLAEWALELNLPRDTLEKRIDAGWSDSQLLRPVAPKAINQSGIEGIVWKNGKWSVAEGKTYMGSYYSLEKAIRVKNKEEDPYLPRKNRKKSGHKGIYWKDKASVWEVYINNKYVGSRKELEEAVKLKETF